MFLKLNGIAYNYYWETILKQYDELMLDSQQVKKITRKSERDFASLKKNGDVNELPFGEKTRGDKGDWRFSIDSVCRWLVAKGGE